MYMFIYILYVHIYIYMHIYRYFPGNSVGKEGFCNAGDPGSIPRKGRCRRCKVLKARKKRYSTLLSWFKILQ